jgi:predicted membrane GTPase involved in stress response
MPDDVADLIAALRNIEGVITRAEPKAAAIQRDIQESLDLIVSSLDVTSGIGRVAVGNMLKAHIARGEMLSYMQVARKEIGNAIDRLIGL